MQNPLRPFWGKFFNFNWKFGLFLIVVICVPRFILVLKANSTGNYGSIAYIMGLSALAPFIFLNKSGQKQIGICKPKKYKWLLYALIFGLMASLVLYLFGEIFYGKTYENWYQYIAKSYRIPANINPNDRKILFTVMAITGMIFSPIGEELFFRGIVHGSFAKSFGDTNASIVDSSAFALTHISHFGLVFIQNQWHFYFLPTLFWVCSMFLVSLLFFTMKKHVGSLLGAILCHAAFNFGMTYCIFYLI